MFQFKNYFKNKIRHPNNVDHFQERKIVQENFNPVKTEYDVFHRFVNYYWNEGETISFDIPLSKKIKVPDDSIIFQMSGEIPTQETEGYRFQNCYNIVDLKCWYCQGMQKWQGETVYLWKEIPEFSYTNFGKEVELQPNLWNKSIVLEIRNFRKEIIHSKKYENANGLNLRFEVNQELASQLKESVYYIDCYILDNESKRFYNEFLVRIGNGKVENQKEIFLPSTRNGDQVKIWNGGSI